MVDKRFEEELKLWTWLGEQLLGETVGMDHFDGFKARVKAALWNSAESLVAQTGQKTPPVNPDLVARERNVILIEKSPLDTDALIVPCKGGFLMKINAKLPLVRQRFACAHEIAHTYFFDLATDPPSKPYKRSTTRYWVEEGLCYEVARRILVPTGMLQTWVTTALPPYIRDFKEIMHSFLVSAEVLAHRIRDLGTWNTLMLIFQKTGGTITLAKVLKSGDKMDEIHVARRGLKVTDPVLSHHLERAFKNELVEERALKISLGNFEREIAWFGASYIGSYPPKVLALLGI